MLTTRSLCKGLPWLLALLFLAFATLTASCSVADRVQDFRVQRQVPTEMSTLWEVYQTVKADYAGKEPVDQRALVDGAVQGMLFALAISDTSIVALDKYDPDAPNLGGVWQAWRIIAEYAKDNGSEVTQEELQQGAIRGMLHALGNPYTNYLDPNLYTLEEANLHSNFEGIGAYVDLDNGRLTIVGLIPNTPAEHIGIKVGDVILEANGMPLEGRTVTEAVLMIRGPRGTPVDLLVQSPEDEPRSVTIIRDRVEQPSVVWEPLTEDIAILGISEFLDNTGERVKEALVDIQGQGYKGLVLDLRGNPGGLLSSTVDTASQFLTEGTVLYHVDAKGRRKDFPVERGGIAPNLPMIVLADGASASGSEVLAGALQDQGRATFVGLTTYGKGSVNELRKLADGSGLYITSALWYTPAGRLIEGEGLAPDVEVRNERVLVRTPSGDVEMRILDRQLNRAIELLEAEIAATKEVISK